MKVFRRTRPRGVGNRRSRAAADVTLYEASGRQLRVSRNDWTTKILPKAIEQAADDPDALYEVIVAILHEQLYEPAEAASQRLLQIEPETERSHIARGVALLSLGRLTEAEGLLNSYAQRHGLTGAVLTNLAKISAERGDQTRTDELLKQSLVVDPNQENALSWFALRNKERSGDEGYIFSLNWAATLPESWRPQLLLARSRLQNGDTRGARRIYEQTVSNLAAADKPIPSDALLLISGDLGNAGNFEAVVEIVARLYEPSVHHFAVGLNLLQVYLHLRKAREGQALLTRLFELNVSPLRRKLWTYAKLFDELRDKDL